MSTRDEPRPGAVARRLATVATGPLLGLLAIALASGCRTEPADPVARLHLTPAEAELEYPATAVLAAEWEMTAPLWARQEAAADPGSGPWVFAHLLDAEGALVRTFDHPLPFTWSPGETRSAPIELWQSALAPPLPAGDYQLTVGLYDPRSNHRWALETAGPEVDRGEYRVARIRVAPPAATAPDAVELAGSWWPAGRDDDRQVIGRRWLQETGTVELAGLAPATVLELTLRIPEAGEGERLVLVAGGDRPGVRISSPCATAEAEIAGAGPHQVTLQLESPAGGRCSVRLEPSFMVIELASLRSRSAALERLTLSPGAE